MRWKRCSRDPGCGSAGDRTRRSSQPRGTPSFFFFMFPSSPSKPAQAHVLALILPSIDKLGTALRATMPRVALPAVASSLLMTLFSSVDAFWVGTRVGASGLAAVDAVLPGPFRDLVCHDGVPLCGAHLRRSVEEDRPAGGFIPSREKRN